MHNAGFQRPKKNSRERRTSSFYSLARLRADFPLRSTARCVATERLEILLYRFSKYSPLQGAYIPSSPVVFELHSLHEKWD